MDKLWALLVVLSLGCAQVIPDYKAKQVINKKTPPEVFFRTSPLGPVVCTNNVEGVTGRPFRTILVLVDLVNMEPSTMTIYVNRRKLWEFPESKAFSLTYPGGIGYHEVVVTFGSLPNRIFTRTLTIVSCDGEE